MGVTCGKCFKKKFYADKIIASVAYNKISKGMLLSFKNKGNLELVETFANWSARVLAELDFDYIIPVPLHFMRTIWRGYNQSSIIAKRLGEKLGKPYLEDGLIRVRFTRSQSNFKKEDRKKNISKAFITKHNFAKKKLLLVDDVITTGSTIEECARILKAAGASKVYVIGIGKT